jgi:hypothetical protein
VWAGGCRGGARHIAPGLRRGRRRCPAGTKSGRPSQASCRGPSHHRSLPRQSQSCSRPPYERPIPWPKPKPAAQADQTPGAHPSAAIRESGSGHRRG